MVHIYFGPIIELLDYICCKKLVTCRKMVKGNKLYKKAKRRYYEDLDIIQILKSVRDSENFRKMFLNKQQQMLMQFGANNLVDSEKEINDQDPF